MIPDEVRCIANRPTYRASTSLQASGRECLPTDPGAVIGAAHVLTGPEISSRTRMAGRPVGRTDPPRYPRPGSTERVTAVVGASAANGSLSYHMGETPAWWELGSELVAKRS
jgi:hypothetical protein